MTRRFDTTTYQDIDVLWGEDFKKDSCDTAIVFMQNEPGFATFLATMGVVGDEEPVARIYSKLLAIEPQNAIPEIAEPCLFLYQIDDHIILRLVNLMPPSHQMDLTNYLWHYPLARDLACLLYDIGINKLFTMTSVGVEGTPLEGDGNPYIAYDFQKKDVIGSLGGGELALTTPSWLVGEMFAKIGDREVGSVLMLMKAENIMGVDEQAVQYALDFYHQSFGLTPDLDSMNEIRSILNSIDEEGFFVNPFDEDEFDENNSGGYHA